MAIDDTSIQPELPLIWHGVVPPRMSTSEVNLASPDWAGYAGHILSAEQKPTDFGKAVTRVYRDAEELLLKKHRDYGPKNISDSPGGPLNGLRVRIWDKVARINNLLDSGAEPENESLRDSFADLLNYSAIALLVLDKEWPQ